MSRPALLASLRKFLDRLEALRSGRSGRSVLAGLNDQPVSPEAFDDLVPG